jgi:hypothetical protein
VVCKAQDHAERLKDLANLCMGRQHKELADTESSGSFLKYAPNPPIEQEGTPQIVKWMFQPRTAKSCGCSRK